MKIKSKKQQLNEKCEKLKQLISWQKLSVKKAYEKYRFKKYSLFSFLLINNTEHYAYLHKIQEEIKESLEEYLDIIIIEMSNSYDESK